MSSVTTTPGSLSSSGTGVSDCKAADEGFVISASPVCPPGHNKYRTDENYTVSKKTAQRKVGTRSSET